MAISLYKLKFFFYHMGNIFTQSYIIALKKMCSPTGFEQPTPLEQKNRRIRQWFLRQMRYRSILKNI